MKLYKPSGTTSIKGIKGGGHVSSKSTRVPKISTKSSVFSLKVKAPKAVKAKIKI